MEPSLAGKKELPEEVFWRDLEEITSHARSVARSATETGRMEGAHKEQKGEISFSLFLSFASERAHTRAKARNGRPTGKTKTHDDLIVAGSAEKSFLSRGTSDNERLLPVSSLFFHFRLLYFSSSFCSARSLARPSEVPRRAKSS